MDYKNQKILITGGTSFLANTLVKTLLNSGCEYIRLTSRDEVKQAKMKEAFDNDARINFILSDIRDEKSTDYSMHDIDIVIHTAALKRIDSLERSPLEALKTNTIGAMNVLNSAISNNVKKVVAISSDKACMPISMYGASKFTAEKIFTHGNVYSGAKGTQFCNVRYGNVFSSTGSLIHIFRKQKEQEIPLTITHPEMTRYFMHVKEAVDLIEYALSNMKGNGEIFVPKTPSFRIIDLAKAVDKRVSLKIIGFRGIEKMHETLVSKEEMFTTIEGNQYYTILPTNPIHKGRWKYPNRTWDDCYEYNSNTNTHFLTVEQLEEIVKCTL